LTVQATATDGTTTEVSTATFNVSVTPVADAPTLTIGAATVSGNEDQAIALPIQAALSEADADAVLSVTLTGVPAGVTLSAGIHNADGSWTLTPAQLSGLTLTSDGEVQHFDLTVTATAVDGGDTATAASASGTLHVNVAPVPETPTLDTIATPASINEGTTIALNLVAHFEADPDATDTIVISGLPSGATLNHGTLNIVTGTYTLSVADLVGLTLTAPDDDTKQITFTVTAHASEGGIDAASTTQQITIAVNPVAEAPTLTFGAGIASGNEDTAIVLPITAALSEADADAVLSVTISGVPAGVTLSAGIHNADGSWTLTPAQLAGLTLTSDGEVQHFDLTVTATTVDGGNAATAASTSGTLHINVTPVADAPTLVIGAATVSGNEDQAIALPIQAALSEADADAVLSVTLTGVPAGVTLSAGIHNADGSWTLTPAQLAGLTLTSAGEVQHFDLTATATTIDGGYVATAVSTSGSFHVDVTPVADAPTLTLQKVVAQGLEGIPIALGISAALGEIDNDAVLTVTISGLPTSGVHLNDSNGNVLTIAPDGSITLTPAELAGLTLTSDGAQVLELNVTATTVDGGNVVTAAQVEDGLTVAAFLVPPTLTLQSIGISGNEDQPIALGISAAPGAFNNNASVTVTISGLPTAGVQLSDSNGDVRNIRPDGTIVLSAVQLAGLTLTSDGEVQHFDLRIQATEFENGFHAIAVSTLHVDVTPGVDAAMLSAGAVDHFSLAANALSSANSPTILNYSSGNGETIDLAALLDAKFGSGSDATKASNFVQVKEDAGGNSATLEINLGGTPGGTFVAAAHLGGIHSGDVVNAILDHAHTTAQLHAA